MARHRPNKRRERNPISSSSVEEASASLSSLSSAPAAATVSVDDSSSSSNVTVNKTTKAAASSKATVVVHPPHAPPYIRCESLEPFVGDPTSTRTAAAESNGEGGGQTTANNKERLNLNLGQTMITPENKRLLWMIQFLSSVLVEWWEHLFYKLWQDIVPLWLKRKLVFCAWKVYLPLHKMLLGRRTAIHRDASLEYHALSSIMYWTRFIPVSVQRMRFSLSQLHVYTPTPMTAARVTEIDEQVVVVVMPLECNTTTTSTTTTTTRTTSTRNTKANVADDDSVFKTTTSTTSLSNNNINNNNTVRGIFLHRHADPTRTTDCIIFWIYGGAFLAGDAPGNTAIADWVGNATNMDVFIPSIRLAPEANMDEILWDVCLAYQWLCRRHLQTSGQKSRRRIQLLGISSGGALCTRLMQLIAEHERHEDIVPAIVEPLLKSNDMKMPCGAVLLGPFVDYTPAKGSLLEYAKHDLVVHDRVLESGLPYLETHIPHGRRYEYSPAHCNCRGLPPLCVVLSMHEAVYDMTVTLINRARSDGVPVTVGCWKYMCHVFSFLQAFIPEGRVSMEFLTEWMRQRNAQEEKEEEEELAAAAAALAASSAEAAVEE